MQNMNQRYYTEDIYQYSNDYWLKTQKSDAGGKTSEEETIDKGTNQQIPAIYHYEEQKFKWH